jgi:two-component system nitrogen regulation response regulator GlnG
MESSKNIWIVDDDKSIRWVLEKAFTKDGLTTRSFEDPTQILAELDNDQPDVIISDIRMQKMDGISLLENLKQRVL